MLIDLPVNYRCRNAELVQHSLDALIVVVDQPFMLTLPLAALPGHGHQPQGRVFDTDQRRMQCPQPAR